MTCDDYLAMLVNANDDRRYLKDFLPTNVSSTCTTTCASSLNSYISNVQSACSEPGDAALRGYGPWANLKFTSVAVETIGRILQYRLVQNCAKDGDGEYCTLQQKHNSTIPASNYPCNLMCAVACNWNKYKYPYYQWQFGGEDLPYIDQDGTRVNILNTVLIQHPVLVSDPDPAWTTIQKCGLDFKNGTAPFDTGIEGEYTPLAMESTAASGSKSESQTGSRGSTVVSLVQEGGAGSFMNIRKAWGATIAGLMVVLVGF